MQDNQSTKTACHSVTVKTFSQLNAYNKLTTESYQCYSAITAVRVILRKVKAYPEARDQVLILFDNDIVWETEDYLTQ